MTQQRARTIWMTLLTVAVVALGGMLFVTRSQVADADNHIRLLTHANHMLAAAAAKHASQARTTAGQAGITASQAKAIALAIQTERLKNIRNGCKAQNSRHAHAVRTLNRQLRRAVHARRISRSATRAARVSTLAFIQDLAPHQNCARVVDRARLAH